MELRYRHIAEDFESGTVPVAVRLEPRFHVGKKAAGYTFLGSGSLSLLKECIQDGILEERPDARLIPRSYYGIWAAIHRVSRKLRLNPQIQTCHGLRKYFENALDDAGIDHEKKMIIEGHFAGTRARHYTERDVEQLREVYRRAHTFIEVEKSTARNMIGKTEWHTRLTPIENQVSKQKILEAKLLVIRDELNRLTGIIEKFG